MFPWCHAEAGRHARTRTAASATVPHVPKWFAYAAIGAVTLLCYRCLATVAGTPATRVAGGTSCVTTAPAATTESAPMVTPGKTVAAVPIHTFLSIVIGSTVMYVRRLSGSTG